MTSLREKLDNLKQSEIIKLTLNGKVMGLRVRSYDINKDKFFMYDFTVETVQNQGIRNFINSIQGSLSSEELISYNGRLCTQSEIESNINVSDFTSSRMAERVLKHFEKIYRYKQGLSVLG